MIRLLLSPCLVSMFVWAAAAQPLQPNPSLHASLAHAEPAGGRVSRSLGQT